MQDNIINENSIEYVLGEILCNNKLTISTALSLFNVTDAVLPACKFRTQGAPKFF